MVIEIVVPSIAESISEVIISSLLVADGSRVQENEGILELETEKVNQLIYASCSGVVFWKVKKGDVVSVGDVVGFIEEGNVVSDHLDEVAVFSQSSTTDVPVANVFVVDEDKPDAEIIKMPLSQEGPPIRGKFVPLRKSKRFAEEEREKMSSMRKTIAKRLTESLHTSAMVTTFNEVNMDAIIDLRQKNQEEFQKKFDLKLGFMSFFIKAVVRGLQEFPKLNAYIDGDDIVYRKYYDIGIAVSTDQGLLVPVLRNCNTSSQGELERHLADVAARARSGKIMLPELEGGGFTITNAGVFGSLLSTPILNPPQVGILAMHKIEKRPIVADDKIIIANMMYVALSYDHRIIDGKDAVSFLVRVKELLETPDLIL